MTALYSGRGHMNFKFHKRNIYNGTLKRIASVPLLFFLIIATMPSVHSDSNVDANHPSSIPPMVINSWNITSPIYLNNTTVTYDGNITIYSGGGLIMHNATLIIISNSSFPYDKVHFIIVHAGGALILEDLDNNSITRNDESAIISFSRDIYHLYYLQIEPNSMFRVINSRITGLFRSLSQNPNKSFIAANDTRIAGSIVNDSDLLFEFIGNITISRNHFSHVLYGSGIIFLLENSIIEDNSFNGIVVGVGNRNVTFRNNIVNNSYLSSKYSDHIVIERNRFTGVFPGLGWGGIETENTVKIIIDNNTFDTDPAINFAGNFGNFTVIIRNNSINCSNQSGYTNGITLSAFRHERINSNIIDSCYYGIHKRWLDESYLVNGNVLYLNQILFKNSYYPVALSGASLREPPILVVVNNSTVIPSKIIFLQYHNISDLVAYNGYLTLKVVDWKGTPLPGALFTYFDNGKTVANYTADSSGWVHEVPIRAWERTEKRTSWNQSEMRVSYQNFKFDRNPRMVNLSSGWAIETFRALPPLERIAVSPNYTEVINGSSMQFTAKGYDVEGNETQVNFTWKVNGTAGTIIPDGLFTAARVGYATVEASGEFNGEKRVGYADVRVLPRLDHAIIFPANATLEVGENVTFDASGFDKEGIAVDNVSISWGVGGNIGSVDQSGKFHAEKSGTGYVTATLHQGNNVAEAKADIRVVNRLISSVDLEPRNVEFANGTSFNFTAGAFDNHGSWIDSPELKWGVSGGIGEIKDGQFKAMRAGIGKVTVTATVEGVSVSNDSKVRVYELPTITIAFPRSGETVSGIIKISGTSSGEDTVVTVSIDDGAWSSVNGNNYWSYDWDTRSVPNGRHKITASVINWQGDQVKKTIYVNVANDGNDITVPLISVAVFVVGMSLALLILLKQKKRRKRKRKRRR